jgi:hypothetical protein
MRFRGPAARDCQAQQGGGGNAAANAGHPGNPAVLSTHHSR